MHLILFPLLIIGAILLVGYFEDIWEGVNLSLPFFEDGKFQLP